MDPTGQFPYKSSGGNEYILIAYNHDGNSILTQALTNRETNSIVDVWTIINIKFKAAGLQPNMYMLDNELSNDLRKVFTKKNIYFQLERPHIHRSNAA